jgi:hypothetical protein
MTREELVAMTEIGLAERDARRERVWQEVYQELLRRAPLAAANGRYYCRIEGTAEQLGCTIAGELREFEGGIAGRDICGFTLDWSPRQEKQ